MIDKIKNSPVFKIRDVRVFGLLIFLIIVLLMTWSGVKAIQTNYGLEKQIAQYQQQVEVQRLQNNNEQLKNAYFNTNQYLELAARQNFGLAAPGETELIVPTNVALAHLTNLTSTQPIISKQSFQGPVWWHNLDSWINFFLHRQTASN